MLAVFRIFYAYILSVFLRMIPTRDQAIALWDDYQLPDTKRRHVELVERVALFFAMRLTKAIGVTINTPLLSAAALLHDIDKSIQKAEGEHHPDTGVRVLRERGMSEVADLVKTHSLSAILDRNLSPKSWEEKLLYLADKMVKNEILDVDKRFALWQAEQLPERAQMELTEAYPKVKQLEAELCRLIQVEPSEIAGLA